MNHYWQPCEYYIIFRLSFVFCGHHCSLEPTSPLLITVKVLQLKEMWNASLAALNKILLEKNIRAATDECKLRLYR